DPDRAKKGAEPHPWRSGENAPSLRALGRPGGQWGRLSSAPLIGGRPEAVPCPNPAGAKVCSALLCSTLGEKRVTGEILPGSFIGCEMGNPSTSRGVMSNPAFIPLRILPFPFASTGDRKSTRLNSSHVAISY